MFTINIYVRFALMALGLIGGIALSAMYGFWYGFPFILVGIAMTIGYFLLGTVQSAAMLLQTGGAEAAKQRLNLTLFPNLLYSANKAYYYLINGTIAAQEKDMNKGEEYMKLALDTGLPTENDKAMVMLNLASIAYQKRKFPQAKNYLRELKEMKVKEPMMLKQMKDLEQALKMKNATMGRQQGKGFRMKSNRR